MSCAHLGNPNTINDSKVMDRIPQSCVRNHMVDVQDGRVSVVGK